MSMDLMVVRPFGPHRVGERITDAATKATVLGSENAHSVVRVAPAAALTPAESRDASGKED